MVSSRALRREKDILPFSNLFEFCRGLADRFRGDAGLTCPAASILFPARDLLGDVGFLLGLRWLGRARNL